jgi:hypothetical protein
MLVDILSYLLAPALLVLLILAPRRGGRPRWKGSNALAVFIAACAVVAVLVAVFWETLRARTSLARHQCALSGSIVRRSWGRSQRRTFGTPASAACAGIALEQRPACAETASA